MQPYMYSLREWQNFRIARESLIMQASTIDGKDGKTASPIGMSYHYVYEKDKERAIGEHEETVLCAISANTDSRRRKTANVNRLKIIENLEKNGIQNNNLSPSEYFGILPNYKFVISPEGNGIDTHRHYEALIYGCIPIIEVNPIIKAKYGDAPILWTHDYSEITENYLQEKYKKMLDKTWDFSHLFIESWSPCEQHIIRERGNCWCQRLTRTRWYE